MKHKNKEKRSTRRPFVSLIVLGSMELMELYRRLIIMNENKKGKLEWLRYVESMASSTVNAVRLTRFSKDNQMDKGSKQTKEMLFQEDLKRMRNTCMQNILSGIE